MTKAYLSFGLLDLPKASSRCTGRVYVHIPWPGHKTDFKQYALSLPLIPSRNATVTKDDIFLSHYVSLPVQGSWQKCSQQQILTLLYSAPRLQFPFLFETVCLNTV